jgi:putative phosphoribosyl transferase
MGATAPGSVRLWNDGPAAGSSIRVVRAALRQTGARQTGARQIVSAVPAAASSICAAAKADRAVCLFSPVDFYAAGLWYRCFSQRTDQEVRDLGEERPEPSAAGYRRSDHSA